MKSNKDKRVTVAFVKAGDRYPAEWYNILAHAVKDHTTVPTDIICWTEDPEGLDRSLVRPVRVDTSPDKHSLLHGPWVKMNMYQKKPPGVKTERLLYLDVDNLIVGDIDPILKTDSPACFMRGYPDDWPRRPDTNTSVVMMNTGYLSRIWDTWIGSPPDTSDYSLGGPFPPEWDQSFVNDIFRRTNSWPDTFSEKLIASYKLDVRQNGPQDVRIVVFHGRPKMDEVEEPWVKERFNSPWTKEHWK